MSDLTFGDAVGIAFCLGLFGYMLCFMTVSGSSNTWKDWALVSFVGLPLGLVAIAVLVAVPGLFIGLVFVLGILAVSR